MHVGIAVDRFARVQIMVIARNHVEIAGLQAFSGTLALSFQRSHLHFQSVFTEKAAFLHHLPQGYMTRRAIVNSDFFCHEFPFCLLKSSKSSRRSNRSRRLIPGGLSDG